MNKFLKATTALIIALAITAVMIVTANAETRCIEKNFTFGSYAPNVHIINAALGTALEVRTDGSVCWKKLRDNADYNDVSQCFTILPAGSGYYAIYEVLPMGGHNPRCLTYKPGIGFSMEWPANGKISDTQRFRFKWFTSKTAGGRTVKKCWWIVCKKDSIAFCTGGWAVARLRQDNWSADY